MASLLPSLQFIDRPACPAAPNAEQILVWAMRRWHLHGAISREIEVGFLSLCGLADVETALLAFDRLMTTLARDGRRPLWVGSARGALSPHERMVVTLLAVHQHRHDDHRRALLRWLAPKGPAERIAQYSGVLALMLQRAGQILPKP